MESKKDFTEDFLKILRSGYNSEEDLDRALAEAKKAFKKEAEEKAAAEKEKKARVKQIDALKTALYFDYVRYLKAAYPDFEPDENTRDRFLKELNFVDYAVGANTPAGFAPAEEMDKAISKLLKEIFC